MDIISLNNLLQQEIYINAIPVQKMRSAPETPYIATQAITKQEMVFLLATNIDAHPVPTAPHHQSAQHPYPNAISRWGQILKTFQAVAHM